ncbi:hypothetical protein P4S83_15950 [Aneurinibacillus thermoaerophilus]|uniref:hypothetical protein n=1 Tax=Aneurinibacillus thermoaerophilus TaxID=143495 RepID=UPI002E1BCAD7|nr:hypothetical protein [Aneurinibacillus thermoaerophilus]MED0764832.1 hypothetical protein [Aneurinibacillus thermoaerophilus]
MNFFKKFSFSYVFLGITIILFSTYFKNYENSLYITLLFLFIANFTCFATEYLLTKYFENKEKDSDKKKRAMYATFIMGQVAVTLIVFFAFKNIFPTMV